MSETMIVNVNSMKGGVGKTTLALAIAFAGLKRYADQRLPVVLIDADIFGTEIVDLLLPPAKGRWSLALLDLLVQSTGGDVTIVSLIEKHLNEAFRGGTGLPLVKPRDLPEMLVIPSLSARHPADRAGPAPRSAPTSPPIRPLPTAWLVPCGSPTCPNGCTATACSPPQGQTKQRPEGVSN